MLPSCSLSCSSRSSTEPSNRDRDRQCAYACIVIDRELRLELPFNITEIDRASHLRTDEAWLQATLKDPASGVLDVYGATKVPLLSEDALDWRSVAAGDDTLIFLGLRADGSAMFACDAGDEEPPKRSLGQMREVGPSLVDPEGAAAIQAIALTSWHRRHGHCSVCGARTDMGEAGHTRHCANCGNDHYPRMDPAVIMLVTDGERCVLGRRAAAPGGRWSTLAGYVEPGEAPESAVVREVFEESGLRVTEVQYRGSQPWPFPSSLMLAFEAHAEYQALVPSPEHQEVRWFSRAEIVEGLADGTMTIPPPISAGHHLIQSFLR